MASPSTEQQSPLRKRTRGTNPCETCRKLRRKCSPASANNERCERCWLYSLECVYEEASPPANPEVDTYRELMEVERQFAVLETEILKLRDQTKRFYPKAETDLKEEERSLFGSILSLSTVSDLSTVSEDWKPATPKEEALPEFDDFVISSQIVPQLLTLAAAVNDNNVRQIAHPCRKKKRHSVSLPDKNQDPAGGPNTPWKLHLTRTGLRIDTTIRTVADLVEFTRYTINNYQSNSTRPFLLPPQTSRQVLQATPMQPANTFEMYHRAFLRSVLDESMKHKNSIIDQMIVKREALPEHSISFSVLDELVDAYFLCVNLRIPLLHRPTFYSKFQRKKSEGDPLSWLLLCSICALMSIYQCEHTCAHSRGFVPEDAKSRALLGEIFFSRAEVMVREHFDEPDPEMVIALINLSQYCVGMGQVARAWKYVNHMSAMCQALKADYWGDKENQRTKIIDGVRVLILPDDPKEAEALIERAFFKRTYFLVMLVNTKKQALFTGAVIEVITVPSMSNELDSYAVVEDELPDIAYTMQFFRQAFNLDHIRTSNLFQEVQRMREGEIDGLSVETCVQIERLLTNWYSNLSEDFRLTSEPFEQIDPQWLRKTQPHPQTVLLTLHYYLTWLYIHRHFLPPSSTTAITPSMLRIVLRSLTICTQAAMIITRLSEYLSELKTCNSDPLALMEASDIHFRLSMSSDPKLAVLGKKFFELDIRTMKRTFGNIHGPPDKLSRTLLEGLEHAIMKMGV